MRRLLSWLIVVYVRGLFALAFLTLGWLAYPYLPADLISTAWFSVASLGVVFVLLHLGLILRNVELILGPRS